MMAFLMVLLSGGLFDVILFGLSSFSGTTLDYAVYVIGFLGVFAPVFFIVLLDDDLKTDKQVKKSSDTRHNKNFARNPRHD